MGQGWEEEAKENNFYQVLSALAVKHSKWGQLEEKAKAKQQKHMEGVKCQAVVLGRYGRVRHFQNRLQTGDARKDERRARAREKT